MSTVGGYEWNDAKADANARKHGVTFVEAAIACEDPLALVMADAAHADRVTVLGIGAGRVLFVVTTERGERTRIISARKANAFERRAYGEER